MVEDFISQVSVYIREASILAYLAVYLGGLLVSFTPCTYPVIPILVAFTGTYGGASKMRGFGGIAALTGRLFGQVQSSPWTYLLVANLCIIMGLAMLDVFSFSLQPAFAARMNFGNGRKGMAGSFLLGAGSGLVMGPCTAPVFAVLLGYVAAKQNLFFGISLFFVFSLGLGTLLILAGTFAGFLASLPKSGEWMATIKKIFGWILIGAGEYFLIAAGQLWS
jgi:cytochrome c-type biogenesis protein